MLADVNHCVGTELNLDPAVQRVITMRRWKVRLMVDQIRIDAITARRLNGDEHVAKSQPGQSDVAIVHVAFARGWSPAAGHLALVLLRQITEPLNIGIGRYTRGGVLQLVVREQL